MRNLTTQEILQEIRLYLARQQAKTGLISMASAVGYLKEILTENSFSYQELSCMIGQQAFEQGLAIYFDKSDPPPQDKTKQNCVRAA